MSAAPWIVTAVAAIILIAIERGWWDAPSDDADIAETYRTDHREPALHVVRTGDELAEQVERNRGGGA